MTVSTNSYDSHPFGPNCEVDVLRWMDEEYAAGNFTEDQFNEFKRAYEEANLNSRTVTFGADFMSANDKTEGYGPFMVKDYEGPYGGHGSVRVTISPAVYCFDQQAIYVDVLSSAQGFYLSKKDFFDLCTAFMQAHRMMIAREKAAKALSPLIADSRNI